MCVCIPIAVTWLLLGDFVLHRPVFVTINSIYGTRFTCGSLVWLCQLCGKRAYHPQIYIYTPFFATQRWLLNLCRRTLGPVVCCALGNDVRWVSMARKFLMKARRVSMNVYKLVAIDLTADPTNFKLLLRMIQLYELGHMHGTRLLFIIK